MPVEPQNRRAIAEERLASLFQSAGWQAELHISQGMHQADMVARDGRLHYVVALKCLAEGRADRVLPLLSQAVLEASLHARMLKMKPLAVVYVDAASASLRRSVQDFYERYISEAAVGLISESGEALFIGAGLEKLNRDAGPSGFAPHISQPAKATELFSDLNQWMLKLLLARELPEHLLTAPRNEYRSATQLAEAAQASPMSASRFTRRFEEEGFLEHSGGTFRLVRRVELFQRWKSAAMRSSPELRMVFLIPAKGMSRVLKAAEETGACIGLFAAATLLKVGHVSGVPPYLYVQRLARPQGWPGMVPVREGEVPQVIIKQSNFPVSLFRASVPTEGGAKVADVLQIWLDASAHPSRGQEQAEYLAHGVLRNVLVGPH